MPATEEERQRLRGWENCVDVNGCPTCRGSIARLREEIDERDAAAVPTPTPTPVETVIETEPARTPYMSPFVVWRPTPSELGLDEPDVEEPEARCSRCGCRNCECPLCGNCAESVSSEGFCYDCDRCADCGCSCQASARRIFEYNEKAEKRFGFFPDRDTIPQPSKFLYLGVELECEVKRGSDSKVQALESTLDRLECCDTYKDWALCKHDGSLDCGFEVVTAPSELAEHKRRWPSILKALRHDMSSWRRSSTGLHIHLSRSWFSALDLAKFVYFINAEENRRQIVTIAGRTSPQYGRLRKKKLDINIVNAQGRYEAVNLGNPRTIEVRMFKGTLNTQHVLADVEFCHALAHYVKQASVVDCTWPRFWLYVQSHEKTYKHLSAYMRVAENKLGVWINEKLQDRSFFEYTEEQTEGRTFQELDTERELSQITETTYAKRGAA
jgi:hypothetical protein